MENGFNLDTIFSGVVTAVQGMSDTVDAFSGSQNRRELINPNLQNQIPINYQTGLPMGYTHPQAMMNSAQQPQQDYSNVGYENQGYPQASVYNQYGMYPQSQYPNQMMQQHPNQGHYDPMYG